MVVRFRVKELAEAHGWSMYKLQQETGLDVRILRVVYRNAPGASVTTATLDRIASVLHVDIGELVESVPPDDEQTPPD